MKICRIGMYENPTSDRLMATKSVPFAHFSAVGTWISKREPCKVCGWHWQEYGPPLLIQWEPSSDVIGDFSWDGPFGTLFVVKQGVDEKLRGMKFQCSFFSTKVVPPEATRHVKYVPYPYHGPSLLWGMCDTFLDLDMGASGVRLESSCPVCGDVRYSFRRDDIVIRRHSWRGERMFRITSNGNANATFVTEDGRGLIEDAGLSNIAFSEAGEIVR